MEETESRRATRITADLGQTDVGTDRTLEVLANERRRATLAYLGQGHTPVGLQDLAEHLAATGAGRTPLGADPGHLALRLHHVHLPKLDDAGFVEYDPGQRLVEAAAIPEGLQAVLGQ